MKNIHIKRLLKIAKHLRSGKLAHKKFNFATYNTTYWGETPNPLYSKRGCGTSGCAIGELPAIWPNSFKWKEFGVLSTRKNVGTKEDASRFLGLTSRQYDFLFVPRDSDVCITDYNTRLDSKATAEQVAAHIEKFCKEQSL